MKLEKLI